MSKSRHQYKNCFSPSSIFKYWRKRERKAKEKNALRHLKKEENIDIPQFKKSDKYEWM